MAGRGGAGRACRRHHGAGAGLPGADRAAAARRPGAAQHLGARPGPGHRRVRPGRWPSPTGCRRTPCWPATWSRPATRPCRPCVLGADEQGSPHHDVLRDADDIGGMPVVVADLHSALPAVLAGLFATAERPGTTSSAPARMPRVVYVMQGRRSPAGLVLAHLRDAAGGGLASRDGDHRPVFRRGPGVGDRAHRAAGRPACARCGRRGGDAGTGQPGDRHPVGLFRGGRGRGGQRGRGPGWHAGGLAPAERRGSA